MNHLLTTVRGRDKDRPTAFTTIGLVAVAVEDRICPYLQRIFELIRTSLPSSKVPMNNIFNQVNRNIQPLGFFTFLFHEAFTKLSRSLTYVLEVSGRYGY